MFGAGSIASITEDRGRPDTASFDLLAACVHCGFCLPACPTWDVLREENDSPRGRLYLMRAAAEERVRPAGAYALHIDRCLGCRACETVCPAGVPFGHLLAEARSRIPEGARTPSNSRWSLALLTNRFAAPPLYAGARVLRSGGVAGVLGRLLAGRRGRSLRLLAATRPRSCRSGHRSAETDGAGSDGRAKKTGSYALLRGCVMDGLFGHVHRATRRALAATGHVELAVTDQVCCGALHAHAGRLTEARRLARLNIAAFERCQARWIVTDSAGCGAALRDYAKWLEADVGWHERAVALAGRVRDVTELLADGPALPEGSRLPGRVGYDAPCHLLHAQGVRSEPLEVLRSIDGLEVEPLPSAERCCGGAGLYSLDRPGLAARVAAPKLSEIRCGRYDWIATGNPGCIMYLGAALRAAGDPTPVVHPVELVDLALRPGEERRP